MTFPIPKNSNRAVFIGKTGCGKTTLAEKICGLFKYVVILDSKGELKWKGYKVYTRLKEVYKSSYERIIWQPNPFEQNEESYDAFFKWIYDRKNTCIYVDEVLAICKSSQNIPFWFKAILTRGRSRNITSLNSTQAPVYVPHFILSQAEIFYIFRTKLFTDREKIYHISGIDIDYQNDLENYEFYWASDTDFSETKYKLNLTSSNTV